MRLTDEQSRIVGGEVRFHGRDVLAMNADELRALRGDGIAMVFQDPMTSLNPVLRIARQLVETMRTHGRFDNQQATARAVSLLGRMGITAPERAINAYPHQFSGGMRCLVSRLGARRAAGSHKQANPFRRLRLRERPLP